MSGSVPRPAARPLGRAARVPRPVCPGCGRCGRGDPAPAPQRAPLRAGVARCGGGGRASPGGVSSTIVRGVWGQALSLPRLPAHWAGCWGPPPTCCGRGCVGVGAQHCPLGLHALRRLRAAGVVRGRLRGGWPATVVWGAWGQALSLPRPPVLWSGQPGFRDPCVPGAVRAGVGTQHRPHSVRPRRPALLAVGLAKGRPRGGCLAKFSGASEVRRCPSPDCLPTGRAVGVRHARAVGAGVWVWGPNTVPLACMPCGGCVPRGWWEAVPGGCGLPPLRGASGVRRCPPPGRPSSGAGSRGSATRVSRVRSVRAWGPSTGPTACALAGRRCSLWGWRRVSPGGMPSTIVRGV